MITTQLQVHPYCYPSVYLQQQQPHIVLQSGGLFEVVAQFNGGDVTDLFTTGLMSEQESTGITHHINNGCIPLGGRGSGGGAD